jgi:hypothetical protein
MPPCPKMSSTCEPLNNAFWVTTRVFSSIFTSESAVCFVISFAPLFAHSLVSSATLEKGGNKSVLLVAVRGLCTLLQDVPHFNFRSNIIATLVPLMAEIDHPEVLGVNILLFVI